MSDKKNPGRFTLQFNPSDPQQRIAADILERQGRHKAQFITNAILRYVQSGDGGTMPSIASGELEALILKVLREHGVPPAVPQEKREIFPIQDRTEPAPDFDSELAQVFGTADMSVIANTLSAFQQK